MKKVMWVFIVTLLFGTMAMASDIAISTQAGWFWQGCGRPRNAGNREQRKGLSPSSGSRSPTMPPWQTWVKDHTGDGVSDLLILCGQFPATIYAPGNTQADGSLAELFLDDGNCIINTGDYMFYVVDGAGTNAEPGLETMMDIAHIAMWDDDTPVVVTADGKQYTPSLVDYASGPPVASG